ncbi:hypothetical protein [Enterovibrio calviensis]|uniref:hypothetical protein n=1 Tax=Enterovibrio calviensis TaxID=91359 RepID=UPI00048172F8|nr:hypothetical protein [Enterovibrio calviensis]
MDFSTMSDEQLAQHYAIALPIVAQYLPAIFETLRREMKERSFLIDAKQYTELRTEYKYLDKLEMNLTGSVTE